MRPYGLLNCRGLHLLKWLVLTYPGLERGGGGLKPRCYYYAKDVTLEIALCVLCKISDRSSI